METNTIEKIIGKKIETIVAELTENTFSQHDDKLSESAWAAKELKKADQYYKYLFGFSIVAVGILFIVSVLTAFDIMQTSQSNSSMASALGIIGVVAASFQYKLRREKLRSAIVLFDLKTEIEKLKK